MKKKGLIIAVVIIAVVGILLGYGVGTRNKLVAREEEVSEKQAVIATYIQRRADLIPNFVNTVKGYSDYEKSTYTAVTEARAAVGKASSVSEQQKAAEQLDSAISVWVNAVTEAYPDLKADKQYTALMDELSGSESRISTARKDYNETVKEYNTAIRRFPASIIAGMCGFEKADYFEATAGSDAVPEVKF